MSMDAERIAAQLADALTLLESNRTRLEEAMAETPQLDSQHVKLANDLAKASVELSKEARSWAKTSRDVGKQLSLQERKDLTVAFLKKLSKPDLKDVLTALGVVTK